MSTQYRLVPNYGQTSSEQDSQQDPLALVEPHAQAVTWASSLQAKC